MHFKFRNYSSNISLSIVIISLKNHFLILIHLIAISNLKQVLITWDNLHVPFHILILESLLNFDYLIFQLLIMELDEELIIANHFDVIVYLYIKKLKKLLNSIAPIYLNSALVVQLNYFIINFLEVDIFYLG